MSKKQTSDDPNSVNTEKTEQSENTQMNSGEGDENKEQTNGEEEEEKQFTIEEAIEYYAAEKKQAIVDLNFKYADECDKEIENLKVMQIRENVDQFCETFFDELDKTYKNYLRKRKRLIKIHYKNELNIRSEYSAKFANIQTIQIVQYQQLEDYMFNQYTRIALAPPEQSYYMAIDKSKRLAKSGNFDEANYIRDKAEEDHKAYKDKREQSLAVQVQNKTSKLFETQSKEISALNRTMKKTLVAFQKQADEELAALDKSIKIELDKKFSQYADVLNKKYALFNNPDFQPSKYFEQNYTYYLADKGLVEAPVQKIREEKARKLRVERMKQKKAQLAAAQSKKQEEEEDKVEQVPQTDSAHNAQIIQQIVDNHDKAMEEAKPDEEEKKANEQKMEEELKRAEEEDDEEEEEEFEYEEEEPDDYYDEEPENEEEEEKPVTTPHKPDPTKRVKFNLSGTPLENK